jgi:hypothetical protein
MAADPLITPMPPSMPSASQKSSIYGPSVAERRCGPPPPPHPHSQATGRDEYHPSDISSSSSSSVSRGGPLSESRETVLTGLKSESKPENEDKEQKDAAKSSPSDSNRSSDRQAVRPKDLRSEQIRRSSRQSKYMVNEVFSKTVDTNRIKY